MVPASGSHDSVVEMALSHEQNLHAPRHAHDADAIELMPLPYKKLLARDSDITDDIRETLAALEMVRWCFCARARMLVERGLMRSRDYLFASLSHLPIPGPFPQPTDFDSGRPVSGLGAVPGCEPSAVR